MLNIIEEYKVIIKQKCSGLPNQVSVDIFLLFSGLLFSHGGSSKQLCAVSLVLSGAMKVVHFCRQLIGRLGIVTCFVRSNFTKWISEKNTKLKIYKNQIQMHALDKALNVIKHFISFSWNSYYHT